MDRVIALRQISVTAHCYSSILFRRQQANPSSRREGTLIQRREKKNAPVRRRERDLFGSSFYMFFSSPGPALCKLGLGRSTVLPEVLTPVLGPSFVLFSRAFPFQVFQPPPFWTPFPYSNYQTVPLPCIYLGFRQRFPSTQGSRERERERERDREGKKEKGRKKEIKERKERRKEKNKESLKLRTIKKTSSKFANWLCAGARQCSVLNQSVYNSVLAFTSYLH